MIGCSEPGPINLDDLEERNGVFYKINSFEPYSGQVTSFQDGMDFYLKNGILDGPYKQYFSNGILSREGTYKNGRVVGSYTNYHLNGKIKEKGTHNKSGKLNGSVKIYNKYGQLVLDETWKNGKLTETKEY